MEFNEETWDDLLNLVEMRKVVPLVGRALSLVEGEAGQTVPIQSMLAERLAEELRLDTTGFAPGWGLSELYIETYRRREFHVDSFHYKLRKILDGCTPVVGPLLRLAEITDFGLFVTTAIDGFLERAVRQVRQTAQSSVRCIAFAPSRPDDLPPEFEEASDTVVYKILGGNETFPDWVVTVEDTLKFVWALQNEKYRPARLFDILKERHLLAIGCQLPDWLGRFFLHCIRGGPLSSQSTTHYLVENQADEDRAFTAYLTQFSQRAFVVSSNAEQFASELSDRWQRRQGQGEGPPLPPLDKQATGASHKVFLSYCHKDRGSARYLYDVLTRNRVDIWKDNISIEMGTEWDLEIKRQILDCACFVVLISKATNEQPEGYFWREWRLALDRRNMQDPRLQFIFPVLSASNVEIPECFRDYQYAHLDNLDEMNSLAEALQQAQQQFGRARRG